MRLNFNGCVREVVIDDRLPSSRGTRSLYVFDRNNPNLLWPALVEKAYLKVRGGYDFPGSNSGTDLWVLTGWLPEQLFLKRYAKVEPSVYMLTCFSDDLSPEQIWHRMHTAFQYGDVMITLGTGRLNAREESDLSLVAEHDYAVLDLKEIDTQKLLLVKNPWSGQVFPGQTRVGGESDSDVLKQVAQANASGIRWMKLGEVLQNFESLYLNWNPGLFKYRQDHHFRWPISPDVPATLLTCSPQFALTLPKSDSKESDVWILLHRHFDTSDHASRGGHNANDGTVEDGPESSSAPVGFISLYLYQTTPTSSHIHLSTSRTALHRGPFVDSPQTLARVSLVAGQTYTIVPMQQALPRLKYNLTMSFFSLEPLSVGPTASTEPFTTSVSGSWQSHSAGGNASSALYRHNPQYQLEVKGLAGIRLTAILSVSTAPHLMPVNLTLAFPTSSSDPRINILERKSIVASSGEYIPGCTSFTIANLAPGTYTLIPSTFEAGQLSDFTIKLCSSSRETVLTPIGAETAGRLRQPLSRLRLEAGHQRSLAPIHVYRLCKIRAVANASPATTQAQSRALPLIRISLEQGQGPNKKLLAVSGDGRFSDAPSGVRTTDVDVSVNMCGLSGGGVWIVVERLGGCGASELGSVVDVEDVQVDVLSDRAVDVGAWQQGDA